MVEISGGTEVHICCTSQRVALMQNNLQQRKSCDLVMVPKWQNWEEAVNAEEMILESIQIVMMEVWDAVWY
jgi:hypothetical protein